jgi:DNA-directed RNA polymerase subunit RPC12/RpoP
MAIAPEFGKTKCPTCSSAMVPVGVNNEEGQTVQYLDCPECGHQLPTVERGTPPWRGYGVRFA